MSLGTSTCEGERDDRVSARMCFSVVSHNQFFLVKDLLQDFDRCYGIDFEVIVTLNVSSGDEKFDQYGFPLTVINNQRPIGFGENHNNACQRTTAHYFVVVNPDIRLQSFDLSELTRPFVEESLGIVAPIVKSESGDLEDSARTYPTVRSLLMRRFSPHYDSVKLTSSEVSDIPWVAGMFMVFKTKRFRSIGGFDSKRFYMYMEDVDICRRISKMGLRVVRVSTFEVRHLARRASRRNLKHLWWHVSSLVRYSIKYSFK